MKIYDKVLGKIPTLLGVPDQTLPGVPIIEIYGNKRVLIEGRCAVIEYSTSIIRLKNNCEIICVSGSDLIMTELTYQQIIITGEIENISISRG